MTVLSQVMYNRRMNGRECRYSGTVLTAMIELGSVNIENQANELVLFNMFRFMLKLK